MSILGERGNKLFVIFSVIMGVYITAGSILRFGYFLSGFNNYYPSIENDESDIRE